MAKSYNVNAVAANVNAVAATLFRVGFGESAQNDQIVRDTQSRMEELANEQGQIALINGPASLPAAIVVAHALIHRFAVVACFDPKMSGYVVASSHGGAYNVGDLIPASDVVA